MMREVNMPFSYIAVDTDLLKTIKRSPLAATLGHERMFFNLHKALEAWQAHSAVDQEGRHV